MSGQSSLFAAESRLSSLPSRGLREGTSCWSIGLPLVRGFVVPPGFRLGIESISSPTLSSAIF